MGQKPNLTRQFLFSFCAVVLVAAACYPFSEIIGYRSVSLILLLTVSFLAMRQHLFAVLFAAILSAAIWDFFFIPPRFTFHVNSSEDILLLLMYFMVALLNGVLSARVQFFEKIAREKEARARTLELYDTLFNALSHELRTPIATILGASDNLVSPINLSESAKSTLSIEINHAAERLQRLTENLLNLSRLDSGNLRPNMDWCDLHELVHTVVNHLSVELKNHRVDLFLSENLPLVKLDFGLMEEILNNLLLNAARHTPAVTRVEILVKCIDNQLFIEILDSGKGFSAEDLPLVFEKFYRAKNAPPATGLGLGLSIVRGLVEAQGGTISVENRPGGGAHFTIKIPVETHFSTLPNA